MKHRAGFTLLEILVVVLIITILSTVVVVRLARQPGQAKIAAARAQLTQFKTALNIYRMDNDRIPSREQGLDALCVRPETPPAPKIYPAGGYLDSRAAPMDPWGNRYVYLVPGTHGEEYEIITYGRDGRQGGEGEDADLSSSDL